MLIVEAPVFIVFFNLVVHHECMPGYPLSDLNASPNWQMNLCLNTFVYTWEEFVSPIKHNTTSASFVYTLIAVFTWPYQNRSVTQFWIATHWYSMTHMWSVLCDRCWRAPSIRAVIQTHIIEAILTQTGYFQCGQPIQSAMLVSHVSCDSSTCSGIWWERVCRVMQWGALYSIGFLHVSWKPVGFKSMLIAKACHMSPDCEWWRKGGLKCSLIKRCAAHVNQ